MSIGFIKVTRQSSAESTPRLFRVDSSSSSSSSSAGTKVTHAEIEARTRAFERHPELMKEYEDLVTRQEVITTEEFWESRKKLVLDKEEEERASGVIDLTSQHPSGLISSKDPLISVEAILDASFSLHDLEKDENGTYVISHRTVPKLYSLYPWLVQAFRDQVPHKKTREQFWHEFLAYVHTHKIDGADVVELKGLEGKKS
jgi:hypothetical protein